MIRSVLREKVGASVSFGKLAVLVGALSGAFPVCADVVTWAGGSLYSGNPNTASYWSDGKTPSADNEYLVNSGSIPSAPNDATAVTFSGGLLTLGDASGAGPIRFVGKNNSSTFPKGIKIVNAAGSTESGGYSGKNDDIPRSIDFNVYAHHVYADIEVVSTVKAAPQMDLTFRSNGQWLYFMGKLTGDDKCGLSFNGNEWSNINTNNFSFFMGDLSGYYGYFDVKSGGYTHTLALGSSCPGTVKLSGGANAFLRTATAADAIAIGALDMSANSALYPEIDLENQRCGTIKVTGSYTAAGTHPVCARFLQPFHGVTHAEAKEYPLLTVPTSVGTLNAADYTLVPMDAGSYPEGALALSVKDDANGDPTLYLTVAGYVKPTYLKTSGTYGEGSASGFVTASHWEPAGVPSSGNSYLVCNGKKLYTPYYVPPTKDAKEVPGPDITFGGDEIVLGEAESAGYLYNQSYAHVNVPKTTLVNGTYYATGSWSGNRHSWLNTELTVLATEYAKAGFTTGATWQHIYLEGSLVGAADAKMYMENNHGTAMDMGIYSDCSRYFGTVQVRPTNAGVSPTFYLYATEFPGTLSLGECGKGAGLSFVVPNGATVCNLEINRPTSLSAGIDISDWSSKPVVVTNSFVQNAALSIAATITGGDPVKRHDNLGEHFVAILKVKKSAGAIDLSQVSVGSFSGLGKTPPDYFSLEVDETDPDYYVLGFRTYPMRYLVWGDDSNLTDAQKAAHPEYAAYTKTQRTSFDEAWDVARDGNNDGRIPGVAWNVNERPNFAYDYVAEGNLRTHSSIDHQYFQGRRLYLFGGITHQSGAITVTNLYLCGGAIAHSHNGGQTGQYADTPYPDISYTRSVWGNAKVVSASTFSIPDQATTNCLRIGLNFSGDATLTLNRNSSGQTIGSYCDICGDNSAFTGIFSLKSGADDTATRRTWYLFHEQKNLGGEPASFNQKGINLQRGVILQPFDSATVSFANRGILVNGSGSFGARAGETFTVDAQVTWMGQANKLGDGVVRFTRPPQFTTDENTAGTDAVIAGKNLLRVAEGSVGVQGDANACDGLQIAFEGTGGLNVKVGDTATTGETALGLRNAKAATPFVLNGAGGLLPVSFDVSGADVTKACTVALCTVPTAAAPAIRGKFALRRPRKCRVTLLPEATLESGMITFRAEIAPTGLVLLVR